MDRFNNPLKLQQGGSVNKEQLIKMFQAAAKNAQVDPEALVQKAQELGKDQESANTFMQGLQLCAQGDPQGIQYIQGLFKQAYKAGGKILDFICKHAKGGYVAGCGCKEEGGQIMFAQDGIPMAKNAKAGRRTAERNTERVPDNGIAKRRRIGVATDQMGGQHVYEGSTIRGSWADTWASVPTPGDTVVIQRIPVANGNDTSTRTYPRGSEEYESVMSRLRPEFSRFSQKPQSQSVLTPVPGTGLFPGSKRLRLSKKAFELQEGGEVSPTYKASTQHYEDDYRSHETVGPLNRIIKASYETPNQIDTIIYSRADRAFTSPYQRIRDGIMDPAGIEQMDEESWKRVNKGFDDAKKAELNDLMNQAGFAELPTEQPKRRGSVPPGWKGSR